MLAAEEFGIGTRNDRVPADPSGIRVPHDVLAADEFPMPAGEDPHERGSGFDPRTLRNWRAREERVWVARPAHRPRQELPRGERLR